MTHSLKDAWFQPVNLKCDLLVSKFAFKCSLYRYDTRAARWHLKNVLMLDETTREVRLYKLDAVGPIA
jgi:hypothetical protein